jgi:hypothetical protein
VETLREKCGIRFQKERAIQMNRKMQEIIATLNDDRNAFLEAIAGLSPQQLEFQPGAGQWSVADIVHHLALVEEANGRLLGMMLKKIAAESVPLDASPDESALGQTNDIRPLMLNRTKKIAAPERVNPQEKLPVEQSLQRLRAAREATCKMAEELSPYDLTALKWPHPVFGDLNLYQWMLSIGLHERRHSFQIQDIRQTANFPTA